MKGRKPLPYRTAVKRVPVNLIENIDNLVNDFKEKGQNKFSFAHNRKFSFTLDFVKLGYGVKGAIWLSHALMLQEISIDRHKWFYVSVADFEKETGLTVREQQAVKKKLKEDKILNAKLRGMPSKTFLKIDVKRLYNKLSKLTGDSNE